MNKQILEFNLTDHFMLKGWDRSIDTSLLYNVLPHVTVSKEEKKVAIVTPSFFSQKGVSEKGKNCLVIILKQKLLVTAFWCNHPNYLFKKEKQAEFQIVY
jgi:hypothetical protein